MTRPNQGERIDLLDSFVIGVSFGADGDFGLMVH